MNEPKKIWYSKTYWANAIVAVVYPFLPESLKNPMYMTYFMIVLNLGLRKISHGKVELV